MAFLIEQSCHKRQTEGVLRSAQIGTVIEVERHYPPRKCRQHLLGDLQENAGTSPENCAGRDEWHEWFR